MTSKSSAAAPCLLAHVPAGVCGVCRFVIRIRSFLSVLLYVLNLLYMCVLLGSLTLKFFDKKKKKINQSTDISGAKAFGKFYMHEELLSRTSITCHFYPHGSWCSNL